MDLTLFAPGAEGDSLTQATDLSAFDLLFVDGSTSGLAQHSIQLSAALARTRVVVVQPTTALAGNVPLSDHPWLETYWAHPSQDNYASLIRYLTSRVLDRPPTGEIAAPVVYPAQGFYHPDAPALFASVAEYLAWYRTRSEQKGAHRYNAERSTIGVYFHLTTYQQKNHAQIDALVRAVERRGHNVAVLAFRSNARLEAFVVESRPLIDVLIFSGTHNAREGSRRRSH